MSLLHPAILYGLGLVALPVILHLLLRQKPRKLVFPALRLIVQRRRQNVRRMRLRHLWLLLLRMLVIGLIVFAIARPSLPAADYGLSRGEFITLLLLIAAGVGAYFGILYRWRRNGVPRFEYVARRSELRGWTTGATLLLLLLGVGWPYQRRVAAEIKAPAPTGEIDLPVAGVFLFDTSLSMAYQQEGLTRLAVARQVAGEHLGSLPAGSRIAVADISNDNPVLFQTTLGAAQARIDATELQPVSLALNDRLRAALLAQEDDRKRTLAEQSAVAEDLRKDRYLRRVYVFTDVAASGWRLGGSRLLKAEIERLKNVGVYLVDVGDPQPKNVAVASVSPSRERIPSGGSLAVSAVIDGTGVEPGKWTAELWIRDGDAPPISADRRDVQLEPGTPQRIEFQLVAGLAGPVVHGDVRLVAGDPFEPDDVRYFTVEVGAAPRVLVAAPDREQANEWLLTLQPYDQARGTGGIKFQPQFVSSRELDNADLRKFDVVCLINVPQLPDDTWYALGQYVEQGGGLAVFLGHEAIDPVAYQRGQAQEFLPGTPVAWMPSSDWRISLDSPAHPLLKWHKEHEASGALAILENEVVISKFWKVDPAQGAGVIATYTDDERSPAVLERTHGRGRTVMITTAVDQKGWNRRWNNLPNLVNFWSYQALAHRLTEYLARATDNVYSYTAGEHPLLRLEASDEERQYLLRKPDLTQTRRTLDPGATSLTIDDADRLGHYDLAPSGNAAGVAGFSINLPADESDFTRLSEDQLNELLGEGKYQVARDIAELKADINMADIGKEVFPIVLLLCILAFCGEHLVANRFYEADSDGAIDANAAA
jgi:hypothetical protein